MNKISFFLALSISGKFLFSVTCDQAATLAPDSTCTMNNLSYYQSGAELETYILYAGDNWRNWSYNPNNSAGTFPNASCTVVSPSQYPGYSGDTIVYCPANWFTDSVQCTQVGGCFNQAAYYNNQGEGAPSTYQNTCSPLGSCGDVFLGAACPEAVIIMGSAPPYTPTQIQNANLCIP